MPPTPKMERSLGGKGELFRRRGIVCLWKQVSHWHKVGTMEGALEEEFMQLGPGGTTTYPVTSAMNCGTILFPHN